MLFVHELGHFIVGRKLGFNVVEFSIFMGPRIFSFERKGIRYSLKAIPLGASVEFAGEYPDEDGDTEPTLQVGDFYERPKRSRALVLLAGPLMNIVTALIAFIILFAVTGFQSTHIAAFENNSLANKNNLPIGHKIVQLNDYKVKTDFDFQIAQMTKVGDEDYRITLEDPTTGEQKEYLLPQENYTHYVMGISLDDQTDVVSIHSTDTSINPDANKFVIGDQIREVNGKAVDISNFIPTLREEAGPDPIKFKLLRGSDEIELEVSAVGQEVPMPLGIELQVAEKNFLSTLTYTGQYMWSYLKGTAAILGQVFQGKVRAQDSFTGPIGIVSMFSGVITSKFDLGLKLLQLLNLFAVISLALGSTNLLPIPPLDGGQLLILAIEAIRKKRLSMKAQTVVTLIGVGFVLLLAFMAFTFDIQRIFTK